ncbi:hypothetical protein EVAR_64785_1 [Eumeta japonica]|uniref:Apple domain-containing protein n=1 Tax=Eumeta variegata TaxID=151549 RepID=A0A4C1ZT51_EUMVA|nr:hypothetical protein EVAR_64785_1 [Eumeta japonica]
MSFRFLRRGEWRWRARALSGVRSGCVITKCNSICAGHQNRPGRSGRYVPRIEGNEGDTPPSSRVTVPRCWLLSHTGTDLTVGTRLEITSRFVLNPLTPVQETRCLLQNDTQANNPMATPQRSVNTYYMVKLQVRTENVCLRPWAFERVPGKALRGLDNTIIYTSTKEACLAACLNEKRYACRSAEYEYGSMRCALSDSDRRTAQHFVQLVDTPGTDYFENLCLKAAQACKAQRVFTAPRVGVAEDKVAQYAGLHYYTDKELQVTSESACRLACEIESEFLCRSFLYLGTPHTAAYNCRLYHLDHHTLPDGPSAYLNAERPLIDDGEPIGRYFENFCEIENWLSNAVSLRLSVALFMVYRENNYVPPFLYKEKNSSYSFTCIPIGFQYDEKLKVTRIVKTKFSTYEDASQREQVILKHFVSHNASFY